MPLFEKPICPTLRISDFLTTVGKYDLYAALWRGETVIRAYDGKYLEEDMDTPMLLHGYALAAHKGWPLNNRAKWKYREYVNRCLTLGKPFEVIDSGMDIIKEETEAAKQAKQYIAAAREKLGIK